MFLKILTVAGLATFEIYAAIPAGFAFQLSPWIIFFASVTGGLAGAVIAAFFGDKIRKFLHKKRPQNDEVKKHPRIAKLWTKYGMVGLGFLGTMTVGAPISIAVGTGLNADIRKLLAWCCIAVVVRCMLFTLIGYYGLKLF